LHFPRCGCITIPMKQMVLLLLGWCFLSFSCSERLDTATVRLGEEQFTVEIARTPQEKAKGLMFRKTLASNHGMLFVFEEDQRLSFWMKNTYIPLSIAFISKDGEVKSIQDMEPESLRSVDSVFSVRYALEVNRGTFERLGIAPGSRIELPLSSK